MVLIILQHTPGWVWLLLGVLLGVGLLQTRTREMSLARVTALPVAMIALSLAGLLNAFGPLPLAFGAWAIGFLAAPRLLGAAASARGATWSGATRRIRVPGSWLPLALILGVFLTRYLCNVGLALEPSLAADGYFAAGCALVYGGFSGLFWGRARALRGLAPQLAGAQPA